mmetsp:Transcript_39933/g.92007  ORF Transcript_39933/g.92007 Transcript_39933/m.92007 type:complete len:122 (+) Transcript_39933:247-612(+)
MMPSQRAQQAGLSRAQARASEVKAKAGGPVPWPMMFGKIGLPARAVKAVKEKVVKAAKAVVNGSGCHMKMMAMEQFAGDATRAMGREVVAIGSMTSTTPIGSEATWQQPADWAIPVVYGGE